MKVEFSALKVITLLILLLLALLVVEGSIVDRYASEENLMKKFKVIPSGDDNLTRRWLVHVKVWDSIVLDDDFLNRMAKLMKVDNYKEFQFHSEVPVFTTRLTPQQIHELSDNYFTKRSIEWIKKVSSSEKRSFSTLTLESFKIGGLRVKLDTKLTEMERLQTMNRIRNWYTVTYSNMMASSMSSVALQPDETGQLESKRSTLEMKEFLKVQTDSLFGLDWNVDSHGLQITLANFEYGVWQLLKQQKFDHPAVASLKKREQVQKVFERSSSLGRFIQDVSDSIGQAFLEYLSNDDSVDMVSRQMNYEIKNYGTNQVIQNGGGSSNTYMWDNGITGASEVVSVIDTGISINHCFLSGTNEPTTKTTLNMNYRKVVYYGQATDNSDLLDENGHGTHVVGTIAGYPQTTPTSELVSSNYGVAKDAKIYAIDAQKGADGGIYVGDLTANLKTALTSAGSRISSNSWGCSSPYSCTFDCDCYIIKSDNTQQKISDDQCLSQIGVRCCHYCNVYDSNSAVLDSFLNVNDEVTVVVAAGNDGKIASDRTIGAPATAKNALTVGASYATTAYYKKFFNFQSYSLYNHENLLGLSSRGPTYDERIKPDIVAPGFEIMSASNTDSCGVKGLTGTSMATPGVAGGLALIRHYLLKDNKKKLVDYNIFNKETSQTLSGTLVKAMAIHSADTMKGTVQINSVNTPLTQFSSPNKYNGFGRMNLLNILKIDSDAASVSRINSVYLANRYSIDANKQLIMKFSANSITTLKITLVWYDLASQVDTSTSVKEKKLINDLNLIVNVAGFNYFGNNGTLDSVNTVEGVTVPNIAKGADIMVRVGALKTNKGEQSFSMVITGDVTLSETPASPSTIPEGDIISGVSVLSYSLLVLLLLFAFYFTI